MRYLLDTQVVIWYVSSPARLSVDVQALLRDPDQLVWVSSLTRAEVAIKVAIGKLEVVPNWDDIVLSRGFEVLDLTWAHARAVEVLPLHHRDPFDRLLVAQAIVEDAILVSSDPQLFRYPVRTLRASPS